MADLSRRTFLKYTAATAGALTLPQIVVPRGAEAALPPGCYWGAFADPHEMFGSVDKFNGDIVASTKYLEAKVVGRKLGMTRHYLRWDYSDAGIGGTPTIPSAAMKTLAQGGRIPFMDWRAQRLDDTYIKWADIVAGAYDTYITSVAHALKKWNKPFFITFNHEPENDAAAMAPGLTLPQAGARYQAAYEHIHAIFVKVGVTKATWVCTLVQGTYAGTKNDGGVAAWFASSATHAGVDAYNRGSCSGGWKSFASLYAAAHTFATSTSRSMVIEEMGCVDETSACGSAGHTKNQWLVDAGHTMKSWPELKAVIYSHVDAAFRGHETDFRVNTSATSLAGYKAVGNDPYFGGTGSPLP
jgi:TAT (twin-arginine translocation) pathway signal sequence